MRQALRSFHRKTFLVLLSGWLILIALATVLHHAQADTVNGTGWTGEGADNNWSTANNWDSNFPRRTETTSATCSSATAPRRRTTTLRIGTGTASLLKTLRRLLRSPSPATASPSLISAETFLVSRTTPPISKHSISSARLRSAEAALAKRRSIR